MFDVFLKTHLSDKYLKEFRKQPVNYVPQNSRVLDIGCGTGALLLDLSGKINYGLGIDTNPSMIKFAQKKLKEREDRNLEFKIKDADALSSEKDYDIAVLSLVVHSLDRESGLGMLKKASLAAGKVIIADYVPLDGNLFVNIDEILAGHYRNFRHYRKNKMENLIEEAGLVIEQAAGTKYKEIGIWVCSS